MDRNDILKILEEADKSSSNFTDRQLTHYAYLANRERSLSEKEKLSKASKGRTMPKDAIEKIRKANLNKVVTKKQRASISNKLTGRKLPKETCEKMSKSRMGRQHSQETITKLKNAHQKYCVEVSQFDLDGNWIKDWTGLNSAAESFGMKNGRAIQLVCNYYRDGLTKGSKQCKGYIWKYKDS